ncbi:MAG: hypothetical protein ABIJ97_09275 [Bacteroidota bacterium]
MLKFITIIFVFFAFFCQSFSQQKQDSLLYNNSVKLDFVPFYFDFFDTRVQIRIGVEYERYIFTRSSISCYMDIGQYDKYDFIKYYDFFNDNQGIYSIKQHISITGFHLLPGYNYYFLNSLKKPDRNFFLSTILDFGYYNKKSDYFNSLTIDNYSHQYYQINLGAGLSLGVKNYYGKHFFIELKTSLIAKIFNHLSDSDSNPLMSLDAQWTSPDYYFWWITNFKAGYDF